MRQPRPVQDIGDFRQAVFAKGAVVVALDITPFVARVGHAMVRSQEQGFQKALNWCDSRLDGTHVSTLVALDTEDGALEHGKLDSHTSDAPHQMFGLVMGITVKPTGAAKAATPPPDRIIRIVQREKAGVYGDQPGM